MSKYVIAIIIALIGYGLFAFGVGNDFSFSFGPKDVEFEVPEAVTFERVRDFLPEIPDNFLGQDEDETDAPEEDVDSPAPEPAVETEPTPVVEEESASGLPSQINLAVPFTPQAPYANWDDVHEETCEEAALLMVHAYYAGAPAGLMNPDEVELALLDMVEKQTDLFGYFEDTTALQTAEFGKIYYGYDRIELIREPTIDDLKAELAAGRPIIMPTAGRVLANPYFSGEGPDYHMIVLKGYTDEGFIANDPGTRRGGDWIYGYDHVMQSIHDWTPPEVGNDPSQFDSSSKVVIVIHPKE